MSESTEPQPVEDIEALLATATRLFAAEGEGDLVAVEVLSAAEPRFEWYSHDNWDGGFDIYNLYLSVPLLAYAKVGDRLSQLESQILEKIQAVSRGLTSDHIQSVSIVVEATTGDGAWREKAQGWVRQETGQSEPATPAHVKPEVFTVPAKPIDPTQAAVMMPFRAEFSSTFDAISQVCESVGLRCVRADDIWENSTFMQDIFDLLYCSRIVVVDFSGRNPNVMYETGIAHTLGRTVIPIARRVEDVPSDLRHHRALVYLANTEGLESMKKGLALRLSSLTGRSPRE